jgi:PAS domain S-box-containing protein
MDTGHHEGARGPNGADADGSVSTDFSFDIARDLICTVNADGYFTSLNAAWERALGWSREELLSRPFIEFVHPDDISATVEVAGRVTEVDTELVDFENRWSTAGGGWRWVRWHAHSDGTTWFAVGRDVTERKEIEERIGRMLTDDRLLAYGQPIVDGRVRSIVQRELLARLRTQAGEVIAPAEFVPAAETCGLIGIIDAHMAAEGIVLARRGERAEVNLSGHSLMDEELITGIERELGNDRAAGEKLVFEITETAAIEHLDAAREFAERLGRLGCRFALDDFGTGYGSLTYLRRLPIDLLKIDSSFVTRMIESRADRRLVRGIVAMAREFDMLTVAEGIEDGPTLELLCEYGVDYLQGFHIGRPEPLAAVD